MFTGQWRWYNILLGSKVDNFSSIVSRNSILPLSVIMHQILWEAFRR